MIMIRKIEQYNHKFWNARAVDENGHGIEVTDTELTFVPNGQGFYMLTFTVDTFSIGVAIIDDDNINFEWTC